MTSHFETYSVFPPRIISERADLEKLLSQGYLLQKETVEWEDEQDITFEMATLRPISETCIETVCYVFSATVRFPFSIVGATLEGLKECFCGLCCGCFQDEYQKALHSETLPVTCQKQAKLKLSFTAKNVARAISENLHKNVETYNDFKPCTGIPYNPIKLKTTKTIFFECFPQDFIQDVILNEPLLVRSDIEEIQV